MTTRRVALCLPVLLLLVAPLMAAEVLFEEDFDDLELGDPVDEGAVGNNVWTPDGPEGWEVVIDMPDVGVTEWMGWTFADATWWSLAAGDQERSLYVDRAKDGLARDVVAVADPDEYDDKNGALGGGTYNTWLSTPPIPVIIAAANALVVRFDSSWRPEDNQDANLTVSFDGGPEVEIQRMESVNDGGWATAYTEPIAGIETVEPDLALVNVTHEIDIPNPGGTRELVITWGMFEAGNDWWWAIDHIVVEATALAVDPAGKTATHWAELKRSR